MENTITKNLYVNVYDISFYLSDDDGNEILDNGGNVKLFTIKNSLRYKPLEYLCEGLSADDLDEI
jgi:hypothetical protein